MKRSAFAFLAVALSSTAVAPLAAAADFDPLCHENLDKDAVAEVQLKGINFDQLLRENLDKDAVAFDDLREGNRTKSVDFDQLRRENLEKGVFSFPVRLSQ